MSKPVGFVGRTIGTALAQFSTLFGAGTDMAWAQERVDIRFEPGGTVTSINGTIIGNGDQVRQLRYPQVGNAIQCRIEMMTDMRERGWVIGRYLEASDSKTGLSGAKTQFDDMIGPCKRQAARVIGIARSTIEILENIRTGERSILALTARGA